MKLCGDCRWQLCYSTAVCLFYLSLVTESRSKFGVPRNIGLDQARCLIGNKVKNSFKTHIINNIHGFGKRPHSLWIGKKFDTNYQNIKLSKNCI